MDVLLDPLQSEVLIEDACINGTLAEDLIG